MAVALLGSMPTLLRPTTKAKRVNAPCHDYASLPAELVVAVCMKLATADGRCAMVRTCIGWRDGITTDDEKLWRLLALTRFPALARTLALLQAVPTSFLQVYRDQLRAETLLPKPQPLGTTLADYVFTVETTIKLKESGPHVSRWTGIFDTSAEEAQLRAWDKDASAPVWAAHTPERGLFMIESDDMANCRLRIWVARANAGRVQSLLLCDAPGEDNQGDNLIFEEAQMPLGAAAVGAAAFFDKVEKFLLDQDATLEGGLWMSAWLNPGGAFDSDLFRDARFADPPTENQSG